ncbi:alpha beta hydrolase fold protein [Moniliophthora roreri]|nr:alpha beta hydrolase fold protein [Moniliophthora roreri]
MSLRTLATNPLDAVLRVIPMAIAFYLHFYLLFASRNIATDTAVDENKVHARVHVNREKTEVQPATFYNTDYDIWTLVLGTELGTLDVRTCGCCVN